MKLDLGTPVGFLRPLHSVFLDQLGGTMYWGLNFDLAIELSFALRRQYMDIILPKLERIS